MDFSLDLEGGAEGEEAAVAGSRIMFAGKLVALTSQCLFFLFPLETLSKALNMAPYRTLAKTLSSPLKEEHFWSVAFVRGATEPFLRRRKKESPSVRPCLILRSRMRSWQHPIWQEFGSS